MSPRGSFLPRPCVRASRGFGPVRLIREPAGRTDRRAIRIGGRRAYEFARQGKEIELTPREVEVSVFEITAITLPEVSFRIVCSKGTYIRSLARDLGNALGVGAYLAELCRTRIGKYTLENALHIDEIQ